MIDISIYEKRLKECLANETGKPFNKWNSDTRSEIAQRTIDNIKEFNNEIELHKNELVIDNFIIARLVDVDDEEDGEFYWGYNGFEGMSNESNFYQASCLCKHILLKTFLPDDEYNNLVHYWNLNNINQAI